jgi:hypothetical protein
MDLLPIRRGQMDALVIFTVLKMRNSEMKCPAAIMNVTWEIPYNLPISFIARLYPLLLPQSRCGEVEVMMMIERDSRGISDIISCLESDDCR